MIRLCFERFVVTTLFRREFLYFYISVPGAEWSLDSDVRCVCVEREGVRALEFI